MKTCSICRQGLTIDSFYRRTKGSADGRTSMCKSCYRTIARRTYDKKRAVGWSTNQEPRTRWAIYRANAVKRSIPFELSFDDFMKLWGQPCHYCQAPIQAIGLDRLDSTKGYSVDNVVTACWSCNNWKSTLTVDEFRQQVIRLYHVWIMGEDQEKYPGVVMTWMGKFGSTRHTDRVKR